MCMSSVGLGRKSVPWHWKRRTSACGSQGESARECCEIPQSPYCSISNTIHMIVVGSGGAVFLFPRPLHASRNVVHPHAPSERSGGKARNAFRTSCSHPREDARVPARTHTNPTWPRKHSGGEEAKFTPCAPQGQELQAPRLVVLRRRYEKASAREALQVRGNVLACAADQPRAAGTRPTTTQTLAAVAKASV